MEELSLPSQPPLPQRTMTWRVADATFKSILVEACLNGERVTRKSMWIDKVNAGDVMGVSTKEEGRVVMKVVAKRMNKLLRKGGTIEDDLQDVYNAVAMEYNVWHKPKIAAKGGVENAAGSSRASSQHGQSGAADPRSDKNASKESSNPPRDPSALSNGGTANAGTTAARGLSEANNVAVITSRSKVVGTKKTSVPLKTVVPRVGDTMVGGSTTPSGNTSVVGDKMAALSRSEQALSKRTSITPVSLPSADFGAGAETKTTVEVTSKISKANRRTETNKQDGPGKGLPANTTLKQTTLGRYVSANSASVTGTEKSTQVAKSTKPVKRKAESKQEGSKKMPRTTKTMTGKSIALNLATPANVSSSVSTVNPKANKRKADTNPSEPKKRPRVASVATNKSKGRRAGATTTAKRNSGKENQPESSDSETGSEDEVDVRSIIPAASSTRIRRPVEYNLNQIFNKRNYDLPDSDDERDDSDNEEEASLTDDDSLTDEGPKAISSPTVAKPSFKQAAGSTRPVVGESGRARQFLPTPHAYSDIVAGTESEGDDAEDDLRTMEDFVPDTEDEADLVEG